MLPKIIHYCWFGDQPIPEDQQELIKEWKSILPDYKFRFWNEENSLLENKYCQKALSNKKWANLSNFVRLQALLTEGGIYLDTDIKLLKSFDPLLHYQCFLGFEHDREVVINNAVIGSISGHPFIARCLQTFDTLSGDELAYESAPLLVTNILKEQYNIVTTDIQELSDVTLLSKDFFYPIHWNETYKLKDYANHTTENTYCVHLWNKSWFTLEMLHNTINDWQKWAHDLSKENSRLSELIELMTTREIGFADIQQTIITARDAVQKDIANLFASMEAFANEIKTNNETSINRLKALNENRYQDVRIITEKYTKKIELLLKKIEFQEEKSRLEKIISDNEFTIKWYQETYEQRSLLGLIKQWFKKKNK